MIQPASHWTYHWIFAAKFVIVERTYSPRKEANQKRSKSICTARTNANSCGTVVGQKKKHVTNGTLLQHNRV